MAEQDRDVTTVRLRSEASEAVKSYRPEPRSATISSSDLAALTAQAQKATELSLNARLAQDRKLRLLTARGVLDWDRSFLGRYDLQEIIGQGGHGDVFVGRQNATDRDVAIKVGGTDGGEGARAFRNESLITAHLEHPNIIPVYDAGDCYLVMKRIRGENLERLIEKQWPQVDLAMMVEVLIQVCNTIAYAHARGVTHRDLKNANVMVGQFGEVLVLDWGLAHPLPDADPKTLPRRWRPEPQVLAGTPACMPPEVARQDAQAIDRAADVFCLGAMLYQILTARLPFFETAVADSIRRARTNRYVPVGELVGTAPPRLIQIQQAAMADDPLARPGIEDLGRRLRDWLHRSGNEHEARRAREEGQERLTAAEQAGKKHWELAFAHFIDAVASFDRAAALCPDMEGLALERREAMRRFTELAMRAGSFQLARILAAGKTLPPSQVQPDHRPSPHSSRIFSVVPDSK